MLSYRSQMTMEGMKDLRDTLYTVWDEEDETGRGNVDENGFALSD